MGVLSGIVKKTWIQASVVVSRKQAIFFFLALQAGVVVSTLCSSADDPGSITCRRAEKGNFNFLAAFLCFGWHFKP